MQDVKCPDSARVEPRKEICQGFDDAHWQHWLTSAVKNHAVIFNATFFHHVLSSKAAIQNYRRDGFLW